MDSARLVLAALAVPVGLTAAASSGHAGRAATFQTELRPLNNSGARGTAIVALDGDRLTVEINTIRMTAGQPHAQHLRFGGRNICPPPEADRNRNGALSATEMAPYTGEVRVSLTTEGDTGPGSALALDRMPVADADGFVSYRRTFTVSEQVVDALGAGEVTIVQYGVDVNGNVRYDIGPGASDLDPDLPAEATFPATCGQIRAVPRGGTPAGGGGTSGADLGLLGLGVLFLAAAGGSVLAGRRLRRGR